MNQFWLLYVSPHNCPPPLPSHLASPPPPPPPPARSVLRRDGCSLSCSDQEVQDKRGLPASCSLGLRRYQMCIVHARCLWKSRLDLLLLQGSLSVPRLHCESSSFYYYYYFPKQTSERVVVVSSCFSLRREKPGINTLQLHG